MATTPEPERRVHLVDGTYELFRAHFSKRPPRNTPDGRDIKATAGLVSSLLVLLEDPRERVTHIGVAFDDPIESWRNDRLASYKDSSTVDPQLLAQFGAAQEAVRALGIAAWPMREHEADDALATAAIRYSTDADQVRILTPDKDLAQVVRGTRIVQVDRARDVVRDEAGVVERFGVPPASIPDLLALVGDAADGIPGLRGFGPRSAAAVLARYGHLEDIPDDGWDVEVRGAARLAATLREHRAEAELYRELTVLATDVPLAEDLDDLAWEGVPREAFQPWCGRLGLESLRSRPSRWV